VGLRRTGKPRDSILMACTPSQSLSFSSYFFRFLLLLLPASKYWPAFLPRYRLRRNRSMDRMPQRPAVQLSCLATILSRGSSNRVQRRFLAVKCVLATPDPNVIEFTSRSNCASHDSRLNQLATLLFKHLRLHNLTSRQNHLSHRASSILSAAIRGWALHPLPFPSPLHGC
jgi:hypothetical protein